MGEIGRAAANAGVLEPAAPCAIVVPALDAEVAMKRYEQKRDFSRTPEPRAGAPKPHAGKPIFVVQKHAATHLHFDLRLEIDGVLKSWAVPKGPSTDPHEKRLAIQTEDHPLEYAGFEGVIPEGEYGGGTVMVWDRGTWDNITEKQGKLRSPAAALRAGHLLFRLHGKRLQGGYALQRIGGGEKPQWLLIKMSDAAADARRNPAATARTSVKSGRTLAAIARRGTKARGR
jgi:DNA ligase D-like protein (predicted 3'-phosphoesterase)